MTDDYSFQRTTHNRVELPKGIQLDSNNFPILPGFPTRYHAEIPKAREGLVKNMLAPDKETRPQTMQEVFERLQDIERERR